MSFPDPEVRSLQSLRAFSESGTVSPPRRRGEMIEELLKTVATPAPKKIVYTIEDLTAFRITLSL